MPFARNLAWLVGIDAYTDVTPLQTAVRDARAVAAALEEQHDYLTHLLLDGDATGHALTRLFEEELPTVVGPDDRVVVYFAGHGIAQDGDDGPEGFLVPVEAQADDRASLVSMVRILRALEQLECRHLLLVLDCCFAGSFRWASTRSFIPQSQPITRKRYQRFLDDPAWQVLTSAADDQKALDVLDGMTIGERTVGAEHSPFAQALLDGLRGGADRPGPDGEFDGVVTAAELYGHVRDVVELGAEGQGKTQTPGLWPLPRHGRGEFLFSVPGRELNLRPDPVLDEAANPWRGLAPYEAEHANLFFGRERVVHDLLARVLGGAPFTAVFGVSGTGKSSVVKAGLLPHLARDHADAIEVLGPFRPGPDPLTELAAARNALKQPHPTPRLLVIDQFEEVWTMCRDPELRQEFLQGLADDLAASDGAWRLLITARSDFSHQLASSPFGDLFADGRFNVPGFTIEELRSIVTGPAQVRVLYFEPPELADRLVDEVVGVPGALPLLSFTLAELYREYLRREADDRALIEADHAALGGVVGALRTRATELYESYDPARRRTLRNIMLRLVALQGGDLAKRRAFVDELQMDDHAESVIADFVEARLFVMGSVGEDEEARNYVEPAHDMLVIAWDRVHGWLDTHAEAVPMLRRVWPAAWEWSGIADEKAARPMLWLDSPYLDRAIELASVDEPLLSTRELAFVRESERRRRNRRRGLLIVVALVGLALLAAAVVSGVMAIRASASEKVAQAEAARAMDEANRADTEAARAMAEATRAEAETKRARDTARVVLARRQVGQPEVGIALLREADPTTPGWMRAATTLTNPATPMMTARLPVTHRDVIDGVRFAPGPRIYLASGGAWIAWSPRERNRLVSVDALPEDAKPGLERGTRPLPKGLLEAEDGWWRWRRLAPSGEVCGGGGGHASPDGAWIVDTSDHGRVLLLKTECRAARPDVLARLSYDGPVWAWRLATDGRLYVRFESLVLVMDPATLKVLERYEPGRKPPQEVWDLFDTEGLDGSRFRDDEGDGLDHWLPAFEDAVLPNLECMSVAWSGDHRTNAFACGRGYLMQAGAPLPITDLTTLAIDESFLDDESYVRRVRLDADGSHLVSLTADGVLAIRQVGANKAPLQLQTRADEIAWMDDDARRVVMMNTRDGVIELHDGDRGRMLDRLWERTWSCLTLEQREAFGLGTGDDAAALTDACWARVAKD